LASSAPSLQAAAGGDDIVTHRCSRIRGGLQETASCWMATRAPAAGAELPKLLASVGLPEPVVIHLDVPDSTLVAR